MNKLLPILLCILVLAACPALAHTPAEMSPEMKQALNYAKGQMADEDFEGANRTFRQILKSGEVLPDDLAYLFSETLFMLGQYQNSRNFLNKYLEVTGKGGNYYEQATELDELLQEKLNENAFCQFCNHEGYRFALCSNCDGIGKVTETCYYCKGGRLINCQTCFGEGVQITSDAFGKRLYRSCPTCDGKGHHSCQVCLGNGSISRYCSVCSGSGQEATDQVCDHEDHDTHEAHEHTEQ